MHGFHSYSDPSTVCLHAGAPPRDGEPLVEPLVQSTTFCRDRVGSDCEHQYSRVSNPTVSRLEETLGALEGAPPSVCFGSGLAAETALLLALLRTGDHIVCGRGVYGGTTRLIREVFEGLGISATFVDATNTDAVAAAITPATRLVFAETPSNPTLELTDIRAIATIAHDAGALLAVDNTFLTPVLQRPLDLGADVCVYSTTKFIEGHSAALGGSLVSRDEPLLERVRRVRKSTGGIIAPLNAWLTLQGVKTLALRVRRQSESAAAIARWLADRPGVVRVNHPSLPDHPQRDLADSQHIDAHGAVVSFEIEGGLEAAQEFAAALRLCRLAEHVGSVETLLTHPASMTHADVPAPQRRAAGISDGLLRLSVGIECSQDIIRDLDTALGGRTSREEVDACLVA